MTVTFNSSSHLVPQRACVFDSGIVPGKWDFANTTLSGLDWQLINSGYGQPVFANSRVELPVTSTSQPKTLFITTPYTSVNASTAKLTSAITGDFDVYCDMSHSANDGSIYSYLLLWFDSTNYIGIRKFNPSGTWGVSLMAVQSGSLTSTGSVNSAQSSQMRIKRTGTVVYVYSRNTSGDSWSLVSSMDWGTALSGYIGAWTETRIGTGTIYCDNVQFISGCPTESIFDVHDSGVAYMDAGLTYGWNLATVEHSLTGSPTIHYQYACYNEPQTPTYNGTWLTIAELQAIGLTSCRYLYLRARISGTTGDLFTALSADVAVVDVTPATKISGGVAYKNAADAGTIDIPIKWVGGTDVGAAGYLGANIVLEIDSVNYYEQSDGSFAADDTPGNLLYRGAENTEYGCWLINVSEDISRLRVDTYDAVYNTTPGDWIDIDLLDFPDRENTLATDTVKGLAGLYDAQNLIPENIKNGITYGVDQTGSYAGDVTVPAAPALSSATAGDSAVTLAIAAAVETDVVYARYRTPSGAWSAESEALALTGSGEIIICGLTNGVSYEFIAYAKSGDVMSVWSAPLSATPNAGEKYTVEQAIRKILVDNQALSAQVGARIYPNACPQGETSDLVIYRIKPGQQIHDMSGAVGIANVVVEASVYSAEKDNSCFISDNVRLALDGFHGAVAGSSGSIVIHQVRLTDKSDEYIDAADGGEDGDYVYTLRFSVWYSEQVTSF